MTKMAPVVPVMMAPHRVARYSALRGCLIRLSVAAVVSDLVWRAPAPRDATAMAAAVSSVSA